MEHYIQNVIEAKKKVLDDFDNNGCKQTLIEIAKKVVETLKSGHKILIAGNGGSAADAQHFAAELVGRFETERKGLPAIALTTDTSILTSLMNDYAANIVFARQTEAFANEGDLFIGISTSGHSENVIEAVKVCQRKHVYCIGMLGKDGGQLKEECDISLIISSNTTARIQEMHEMCIHIICAFVDQAYAD